MTLYSLDTSALIDGLERYYPRRHFPALWDRFDDLVAEGRALISEEVWDEARRKDAATKDWCDEPGMGRDTCKVATDARIAAVVGDIMAAFPAWATQGQRNGADPFVIAVAETMGAMVITGEKNGGPANPKIPYVSDQRGVPCGRFIDIILNEDWVVG